MIHSKARLHGVLLALLATAACEGSEGGPASPAALDFSAIASTILSRLDLQPGERVLLVAAPGRFDPLVTLLREGIRLAEAEDLGAVTVAEEAPEGWSTAFTQVLSDAPEDALPALLREVDAAVMMPGATPSHPVYAAMQEVLRNGHGRTVHFHWAGAYRLDGTLLPDSPGIDAFFQRALTGTDYDALARAQRDFEDAMRGAATVRVTTPAGTDLSFRIGDRPVTRQDGDASAARAARARVLVDREVELPAGAVRVAPLEETVNGRIAFPPSVWGKQSVRGLVLTFEAGRVVDARADAGLAAAQAEMDAAGRAGRAFREFALGFNPLLAVPDEDPWIPYYGYGAGVVRLSLGDNTELGGKVGGGYVRWNFFTDATVTVDGQTWVEAGKLVR